MSEAYKAKVFKSGNSLALRLPKALGIQEGAEMTLREDHGRFTFEPAQNDRKIDVSKFAGAAPWLEPLPREDFEDSPRDWHFLDRDASGA
jgi:antitoxin VapB